MKLSYTLMYDGNPRAAADQVAGLEQAGIDVVWVAEAYGFDSPTLMGYLAARTETVEIGSAILNIYSRTPSALAQTAWSFAASEACRRSSTSRVTPASFRVASS